MNVDLREVRMPKDGLWRAARWRSDLDCFPAPARPISEGMFTPGPPLNEWYPRWEDVYGQFATLKFSATAMAAVGRTLTDYRGYREEKTGGVLDMFKAFFAHGADYEGEPVPVPAEIPNDYFLHAHRLHLNYDPDLSFIDVEHPRTRETVAEALQGPFALMQVTIGESLSQNRDRRVTRLVMSALHDICRASGRDQVVGIRYKTPDPEWEAFVMWDPPPPPGLDLPAAQITRISRGDQDLIEAARFLGLKIP
jgi:hypothetical protein